MQRVFNIENHSDITPTISISKKILNRIKKHAECISNFHYTVVHSWMNKNGRKEVIYAFVLCCEAFLITSYLLTSSILPGNTIFLIISSLSRLLRSESVTPGTGKS